MNPLEIKIFLFKQGLSITTIAKELSSEYGATVDSLRTMLTEMFYHGRYNERLARLVNKRYGISIKRPRHPRTVSEAVRQAA